MLIEDGKLNQEEFKLMFDKMTWIKAPRSNVNQKDLFYFGTYEDDDIKIYAAVRPSMRMEISETFKKRDVNGLIPPETYKGRFYECGTTVEILINNNFIDKIEEVCHFEKKEVRQKIEW